MPIVIHNAVQQKEIVHNFFKPFIDTTKTIFQHGSSNFSKKKMFRLWLCVIHSVDSLVCFRLVKEHFYHFYEIQRCYKNYRYNNLPLTHLCSKQQQFLNMSRISLGVTKLYQIRGQHIRGPLHIKAILQEVPFQKTSLLHKRGRSKHSWAGQT